MIGILGGTFDPIHLGHIKIANLVAKDFAMSEIRLMPSQVPVHRNLPQASTADRIKMLQLAVNDHSLLKIDLCEINRKEASYSVDSLELLRTEIGTHESIAFILGMDAFNQFTHWKNFLSILKLCYLIVLNRPGSTLSYEPELTTLLKTHQISDPQQLNSKAAGYIYFYKIEPIDISASRIRAYAQSTGIAEVDEYIKKNNLYKTTGAP